MKKTFKVVMLPAEKASPLLISSERDTKNQLLFAKNYNFNIFDHNKNFRHTNKQHLYILSDDEIKEGDWFTTSVYSSKYNHNTLVHKCSSRPKDKDEEFNWVNTEDFTFNPITCKKIVATTDSSLLVYLTDLAPKANYPLPQISESFIKAFIKAYNEGKPITEIDLEMCIVGACTTKGAIIDIKTRPDNTIIVHQSKMYSRDEVVKLLQDCAIHFGIIEIPKNDGKALEQINNWIKYKI